MTYRQIMPLAAYVNRVGAEQLNFRKFIIRDYRGNYYVERTTIILANDGTITCSNPDYAPTGSEQTAIKEAFAVGGYSIPQWVKASPAKMAELRALIGNDDPLFEFYERSTDTIVMVQQRAIVNGRKAYLPWSFWSDGLWRRMECDAALPFWKPRHTTHKRRIMVHEGAKAAAYMHALVNDPAQRPTLDAHPWVDELVEYEHWGIIGGALAPQRTNFMELRNERPLELVYVCDNDHAGKEALRIISRNIQLPLKGVMFDDAWPKSWDMADKLPPAMFGPTGRWIGQSLRNYMKPVTWATEQFKVDKKTVTNIRRDFAEEWLHCVTPEVYVHREWPSYILTPDEFNNVVTPYSDVNDTAALLRKSDASKTAVLKYDPSIAPGIYAAEGQLYINTHKPSGIKPEAGDATPWLDFMMHLVPEEHDRLQLLRWCATLIARPDVKMHYGILLISETQGVGKGTLGERILGPLLGMMNVSQPSENDICESNFNYWAAHKRLAIVHEIYAGHSAKAYNRLKSIITERYLMVNKKYMAAYDIENWLHIFACSNSKRALKLDDQDRRWLVPGVGDDKRSSAYWQEFNNWLTMHGGLHIIKWWAREWLKENAPVMTGEPAPMTLAKGDVITEGYSPGQRWVKEFLEALREKFEGQEVYVTDEALIDGIRFFIYDGRQNDYLEKSLTVQNVARSCGWFVGKERIRRNNRKVKLVATTAALANKTAAALDSEHLKPKIVIAEARDLFGELPV